jgi:hypothetical protein
VSRRKGQAKRRRRKTPQLTDEQRIALEVSRRAAENRVVARVERRIRSVMEAMDAGDCAPPQVVASDLTRWERCELDRLNVTRAEPLYCLPDSAYEARRLMRYAK